MIDLATAEHLWPAEMRSELRRRGDPRADAAYRRWIRSGPTPDRRALPGRRLARAALPPAAVDRLLGPYEPPAWRDLDAMRAGAHVWSEYGAYIGFALFVCSLPQGYVYAAPARALYVGSALARPSPDETALPVGHREPPGVGAGRRLQETATFLQTLLAPNAMSATGAGVAAARHLRMVHAAMRHLIVHDPDAAQTSSAGRSVGPWPTDDLGTPLCQADLVGTLLTFATIPFELMHELDVDVSESDEEAYLHLWSVIGHAMGVDTDLLPLTSRRAEAYLRVQRAEEMLSSPEAAVLASHLVEAMRHGLPRRLGHLPVDWIRHFSGDEVADALGLGYGRGSRWWLPVMRTLTAASNVARQRSTLARRASDALIQALVDRFAANPSSDVGRHMVPFDITAGGTG